MPSGLIEDEYGVGTRGDPDGDLGEMKLHCFGVAGRQHEGGAGSEFGTHGTEQIGRLGTLIMDGPGPRAFPGPTVGQLVLLTDPHLVLEPHLYRCARTSFWRTSATRMAKFF
jgi:hypothetical protein